ncbi:DUF6509 family protein [Cytobacillus sp. NCCP-133]|uniref:DUF6509 family protein n=1 Tax=Cytobacillus sp. NCCP-133 TaxID=766848 RepID=UPI002232542D|nr:DUF6509 family protein [Cytobacillus sp. NCCP-133]GLB61103.1 hypothetical protein NCCP133_32330 [Cytobacillus sp. NCCP-133]
MLERVKAMNITGYSIESIKDPTGILSGDRYEFYLDIDVDEDDELYSENGIKLRVLFYKNEDDERILNYHFLVNQSGEVLEFALDEDEEKVVSRFCSDNISQAK